MKEQLLRQLHSVKTMSIVGMCKNAGKTTMLNWLLEQGRLQGVLGLTSIGRDGESTDVVTGTEKPGIFVREGTLIATAQDMLRLGDITKEILMTKMCIRDRDGDALADAAVQLTLQFDRLAELEQLSIKNVL